MLEQGLNPMIRQHVHLASIKEDTWLQNWPHTGTITKANKRNGGKKTIEDIHYYHDLEKDERLKNCGLVTCFTTCHNELSP